MVLKYLPSLRYFFTASTLPLTTAFCKSPSDNDLAGLSTGLLTLLLLNLFLLSAGLGLGVPNPPRPPGTLVSDGGGVYA